MAEPQNPKEAAPGPQDPLKNTTIEEMELYCSIYDLVRLKKLPIKQLLKGRTLKGKPVSEKWFRNNFEKRYASLLPPDGQLIGRDEGGYSWPTPHGNDLYDIFKAMLRQHDRIWEQPALGQRRVKIITFRTAIDMLLNDSYKRFRQKAAEGSGALLGTDVTIHSAFAENIHEAVQVGRYHMGVGYLGAESDETEKHRLFDAEMVLAFPSGYTFQKVTMDKPLSLADLAHEPLLIPPEDSVVNSFAHRHVPEPVRPGARLTLPSMGDVYNGLRKGLGVAFCFKELIPPQDGDAVQTMNLDHLKLQETRRKVWHYVRQGWETNYSPAARMFAECVLKVGEELDAGTEKIPPPERGGNP